MSDTQYVERPLVYLAGPYAHPDPLDNTRHTIDLAEVILEEGVVTPFIPHLTALWHVVRHHPVEFWYAYDLAVLARCDALLRLPGMSRGADEEVAYANASGIPVFTDRAALYEWTAG